jgi:addiction module HigA family antidote
VLAERFLRPMRISQNQLAAHIGEYPPNLSMIINGKRRITPHHAWMLGHALGTSPEYWMDLQTRYDLWESKPRRPIARLKSNPRTRHTANGGRRRR